MPSNDAAIDKPIGQFRLLLWLKFRLLWGALRRDQATVIGSILTVVILLPASTGFAVSVYQYASEHVSLLPALLEDLLTAAYLIWFLTPLLGFSLNESYDPTRLFVYPVRYQTMLAANAVGSLFELSTLVLLPILIALLLAAASSAASFVACAVLLFLFVLQTIATGQAITLALLGILRSRRFRDIMIVLFPMLALARYIFTPRFAGELDIQRVLTAPGWRFADFLPPGWTAAAMVAAQHGDWLHLAGFTGLLLLAAAATVGASAFVLHQLFIGERGSIPTGPTKRPTAVRREAQVKKVEADLQGAWLPILALSQKEFRYVVREPQFKALGMNALYMLAVCFYSFFRIISVPGGMTHAGIFSEDSQQSWLHIAGSIGISGFLLLGLMPLIFNIFGGEGAAITMLFSFPVPRRYFVMGKNLAYGSLVLLIGLLGIGLYSYLIHTVAILPLALVWLVLSTLVALSAGNLVSVRFPTKFVVRGSRISRGGQVSVGSSRSPGAGCAYGFLYLLCWAATFIAEIPVVAAILLPSVGLIGSAWYILTLPLGVAYAVMLYLVSLKLIDVWMVSREQDIILKLVPMD